MELLVDEICFAVMFNELYKFVTVEFNFALNIVYLVVICIGLCVGMIVLMLYGDFV